MSDHPIHDHLAAKHLLDTCDWDAVLAEYRAEMDADYWGEPS